MKKKHILIPLGLGAGTLFLYLLLRPAKVEPQVPPMPDQLEFIEQVAKHYYLGLWGRQMTNWEASQISISLTKWTEKRNLDLFSCLAIMAQESCFNRYALSSADTKGLWQLKEIALLELERVYGITVNRSRIYEIDYNIMLGTLYYLYCVGLAEGNRREAMARYYKTTEYWEAWWYADTVLLKRSHIVSMYGNFILAIATK